MKNINRLLAVSKKLSLSKTLIAILLMTMGTSAVAQTVQTLYPTHDTYLETISSVTTNKNDEFLRLESSTTRNRKGYVMFDLSGINGTITGLDLQLTVYTDDATAGTVNVFRGSTDSWTEGGLTNVNKPVEGSQLGSIAAPFAMNAVKTTTLNHSLIGSNSMLTLILTFTGSTQDVAFASNGPETSHATPLAPIGSRPKLIVTYTPPSSPDTVGPNPPATVTAANATTSSVDLSWTASSDVSGIKEYKIYADENGNNNYTLRATSVGTGTSYTVNGLNPSTAYRFKVAAVDNSVGANQGNQSAASASITTLSSGGGGGGYWTQSGSNIFYNVSGAKVGIGTTNLGNYELSVNGEIHTKEVKVDLIGWADYVFAKDYTLPTLEEVQKHIEEKGHLINIPSATEVEANGIELGEMNKLLLEKIEELTLYIIQQNKNQELLESRIKILETNK